MVSEKNHVLQRRKCIIDFFIFLTLLFKNMCIFLSMKPFSIVSWFFPLYEYYVTFLLACCTYSQFIVYMILNINLVLFKVLLGQDAPCGCTLNKLVITIIIIIIVIIRFLSCLLTCYIADPRF